MSLRSVQELVGTKRKLPLIQGAVNLGDFSSGGAQGFTGHSAGKEKQCVLVRS